MEELLGTTAIDPGPVASVSVPPVDLRLYDSLLPSTSLTQAVAS